MRQAMRLLTLIALAFAGIHLAFGPHVAFSIAFGAISLLAMMISGTFLWLWLRRETPLALGMSFSWAGASSVMGWWWVYHSFEHPAAMQDGVLLLCFLGLYFVGVVQHCAVMQRSMNVGIGVFALPVLVAIALAAGVAVLF